MWQSRAFDRRPCPPRHDRAPRCQALRGRLYRTVGLGHGDVVEAVQQREALLSGHPLWTAAAERPSHVAAERPVAVPASAALGLALACALTDTVLRPRTSVVCAVCVHRALTTDVRRGGHDTVKRPQEAKRIPVTRQSNKADGSYKIRVLVYLLTPIYRAPYILYTRNTVARVQL